MIAKFTHFLDYLMKIGLWQTKVIFVVVVPKKFMTNVILKPEISLLNIFAKSTENQEVYTPCN
jgi:hypothetical protein